MKRSESSTAAIASTSACFVEPTSVTTALGDDACERRRHQIGQRGHRRGAEDHLGAGDGVCGGAGRAVEGAELDGAAGVPFVRVVAADLGAETVARGEADRAADQPDAENRDPRRMIGSAGHRAIIA